MTKNQATEDQVLGSLYGGALGDAFASAAEFSSLSLASYESSWSLTDDTQLTVSTCRAITASKGVSAEAIAQQLRQDFERGLYSGLGSSTLGALRALATGAHWALAGIQGERAAGNGAAMRSAPLAFLLDFEQWSDRQAFRDVVRITHRNEEALAGAQAFAHSLHYLTTHRDSTAHELLSHTIAKLFDSRTRDNLLQLQQEGQNLSYPYAAKSIGTSGFAAHSVPLALVASVHGMREGMHSMFDVIVEEGGDTDTIASMAGQLLGVTLGLKSLPADLLEKLPEQRILRDVFPDFARFAARAT